MANNNGISIKYGSDVVVDTTAGLVPGKTATLNTSGHLLENDITVDFPAVNATAAYVLEGKTFYGAEGMATGTMPNYYDGDLVQVLDATHPRMDLEGAYKGQVYIDIQNPDTITTNGTYEAGSEKVMTKVIVNVPSPEVWDKSYTIN